MSRNERPDHICLREVTKTYAVGGGTFRALDRVSLELPPGTFTAVVGRSGSGKSTLVNLLAGLDHPTSGSIRVGGVGIDGLSEDELSLWRGKHVGVVFQAFQLLPTLTVAENVALPMDFCGTYSRHAARQRALELLSLVKIADQADKLPSALSGGQQQRVAIARALANDPTLIVADEPTGNLDLATTQEVLDLLAELPKSGRSLLMVTHDPKVVERAGVVVSLSDGRIVDVKGDAAHA